MLKLQEFITSSVVAQSTKRMIAQSAKRIMISLVAYQCCLCCYFFSYVRTYLYTLEDKVVEERRERG